MQTLPEINKELQADFERNPSLKARLESGGVPAHE